MDDNFKWIISYQMIVARELGSDKDVSRKGVNLIWYKVKNIDLKEA